MVPGSHKWLQQYHGHEGEWLHHCSNKPYIHCLVLDCERQYIWHQGRARKSGMKMQHTESGKYSKKKTNTTTGAGKDRSSTRGIALELYRASKPITIPLEFWLLGPLCKIPCEKVIVSPTPHIFIINKALDSNLNHSLHSSVIPFSALFLNEIKNMLLSSLISVMQNIWRKKKYKKNLSIITYYKI